MVAVKVKDNDGVVGYVDVEHWANPGIFMMDFTDEKSGDFWPKYKEDLEYVGIEEF